ncbi:MAG: hypothetical protein ATN35_00655 [Epulopiscium sp. Nele67-Bin004]|nr:MAG: hypothetical protein ATN35_00655 [Epulopiscium sp. Nele67-Bin004]
MDILIGQVGSGKTTMCYQKIRKTLQENPYKKIIMLVPEQFNLEVQKDLAMVLQPGLFSVEVLSFRNLIQRALVNVEDTPIIDDLERVMILKRVIEANKSKLIYFKKSQEKDGFIDEVNKLLATCEGQGIGIDELDKISNTSSTILNNKLEDIKQIYKWFYDYIENKFLTVESSMQVLKNMLIKTKAYDGALILVDGFYTFTAMQLEVLQELYVQADQLVITLPMDKQYAQTDIIKESNIFYNSIKMLRIIQNSLEKSDDEVKIHFMDTPKGDKATDLKYLQANYFNTFQVKQPKNGDSVKLYAYSSLMAEVETVACQIKQLVRDENYRYRDIVILVGDISVYRSYISSTFAEYDIPYFLDTKRNIHTNPLVQMVINLLDVIATSWSYNSMMSLLKTGMLNIDDIDYLENYVIAQGIRRKKQWKDIWQYGDQSWDFKRLNNTREIIDGILTKFEDAINKEKNTRGRVHISKLVSLVYKFLEEHFIFEKVQSIVEYHKSHQNLSLELENSQIWEQVMKVLESLVHILGDEEVSVSTFKNILSTSFSYQKMGIIPASQDEILVGEVERTRIPMKKAIFILGVNEGMLPSNSNNGGLFSEMDRFSIQDICQTKDMENMYDTFIHNHLYGSDLEIYTAINRATHLLYMSYIMSDDEGDTKRASILFNKVNRLFEIQPPFVKNFVDSIYHSQATLGVVGEAVRQEVLMGQPMENDIRDALSWYKENYIDTDVILRQLFYTNQQQYLDSQLVAQLYNNNAITTVSKLERFRKCPCSYFIEYGLKASERKLFKWDSADIGTIFHAILEQYPKELELQGVTWVDVDKVQQRKIVHDVVTAVVAKYNRKNMQTGQLKYTVERIEKMALRAIDALTYQLKKGEFEPNQYEYKFGYNGMPDIQVQLDDGSIIKLQGTIDRVDIYTQNGTQYIKILDYKTGQKDFDLVEIYYGLQLQLLLYLDAYLKSNKNTQEAGVYYFKLDAKYVKVDASDNKEVSQDSKYKQFKMSGLTLEDENIATALEKDLKGNVIPVTKTTKGFHSKSVIADEQQFVDLRQHVYNIVSGLGKDILDGKISATPYKLGKQTGCDYCKYHGICKFDENLPDNNFDICTAIGKEGVINSFKKGSGDSGGLDDSTTKGD